MSDWQASVVTGFLFFTLVVYTIIKVCGALVDWVVSKIELRVVSNKAKIQAIRAPFVAHSTSSYGPYGDGDEDCYYGASCTCGWHDTAMTASVRNDRVKEHLAGTPKPLF